MTTTIAGEERIAGRVGAGSLEQGRAGVPVVHVEDVERRAVDAGPQGPRGRTRRTATGRRGGRRARRGRRPRGRPRGAGDTRRPRRPRWRRRSSRRARWSGPRSRAPAPSPSRERAPTGSAAGTRRPGSRAPSGLGSRPSARARASTTSARPPVSPTVRIRRRASRLASSCRDRTRPTALNRLTSSGRAVYHVPLMEPTCTNAGRARRVVPPAAQARGPARPRLQHVVELAPAGPLPVLPCRRLGAWAQVSQLGARASLGAVDWAQLLDNPGLWRSARTILASSTRTCPTARTTGSSAATARGR